MLDRDDRNKLGEQSIKTMKITAVKCNDGSVCHYIETQTDIAFNDATVSEIERLAYFDCLTGLANRRLLLDRLKVTLAASDRSGRKGALLFIDVDNFKTLNDSLGHDFGDLLLKQIADRLSSCVREGDTVARFGGDEFVVMLKDLSQDPFEAAAQTEIIGEKILSFLNHPYQLGSHTFYSSVSVGVAVFDGQEKSIDRLLKQADIAMYQAKTAGRNGLRFFDNEMQANLTARFVLETDLRSALKNNEFQLFYQPQVDHDHKIFGAEALIRWHHPARGMVLLTEFMPLVEETGFILSIDEWVIEMACFQFKQWEEWPDFQLSINVSVRQFHQAHFVQHLISTLNKMSINPQRLQIEISEKIVNENFDSTILKMNLLRKFGVSFCLDDFDMRYLSLTSLKKLPLNQLKINQNFVAKIGLNTEVGVIVKTIITIAKNFGIKVIAQGVETDRQLAFLQQYGCNYFQGFLFGKPLSLNEFTKLHSVQPVCLSHNY